MRPSRRISQTKGTTVIVTSRAMAAAKPNCPWAVTRTRIKPISGGRARKASCRLVAAPAAPGELMISAQPPIWCARMVETAVSSKVRAVFSDMVWNIGMK